MLVASRGYYNGDPEYIYYNASAVWVKEVVDFITFTDNVKNIKFDKK